jgi:signal transduction histidine kinase
MNLLASLRSRLLLGAFLWTVGLSIGMVIVANELMRRHGTWPRIMHGTVFEHTALFTTMTVVFLAAGLLAVRSGMLPFSHLRERLGLVNRGRAKRLEGTYPAEIQPLVDDLNALLEHQEQMVRRAVAKAGDLAHGLKTPLAVLSQEAERAEADGHGELASTISQQVERMRRQVEYHLAHARAAASGATPGARCPVLASVEGLSRTLQRVHLHAGRGIAIDIRVAPDHAVRGQREDLDEMLGNLLDNACKWARTTVAVESREGNGRILIAVDDDGPGLPEHMWNDVLQRGVRADEAAPGSGFGLAIVRELAELYGGSIALARSSAGGLRAELELPAA